MNTRLMLALLALSGALLAACEASQQGQEGEPESPPSDVAVPDASEDMAVREAAQEALDRGSVSTDLTVAIGPNERGQEAHLVEEVVFDGPTYLAGYASMQSGPAIELYFDEDRIYAKTPEIEEEFGDEMWLDTQEVDTENPEELVDHGPFSGFEPLDQIWAGGFTSAVLEALADAEEPELIGRDVVGSVAATQYLARIEDDALNDEPFMVEVWVGDDGLIHKVEGIVSGGQAEIGKMVLELRGHGEVSEHLGPGGEHQITTPQEQEALAEEAAEQADEAEDRRRAGLTPEEIRRLSDDGASRFEADYEGLFTHPETQELCHAENLDEEVATEFGYATGGWVLDCGAPDDAENLELFCAAGARLTDAISSDSVQWANAEIELETMAEAWGNAVFSLGELLQAATYFASEAHTEAVSEEEAVAAIERMNGFATYVC